MHWHRSSLSFVREKNNRGAWQKSPALVCQGKGMSKPLREIGPCAVSWHGEKKTTRWKSTRLGAFATVAVVCSICRKHTLGIWMASPGKMPRVRQAPNNRDATPGSAGCTGVVAAAFGAHVVPVSTGVETPVGSRWASTGVVCLSWLHRKWRWVRSIIERQASRHDCACAQPGSAAWQRVHTRMGFAQETCAS